MSGDLPESSKLIHRRPVYVKRAKTAENCHRRPLPPKPEVEIWRKLQKWTRSYGLLIRLSIHYRVYLNAIWPFTGETLLQGPLYGTSDLAIIRRIPCTKAYDQPCLNVNNSKIWRTTLISFSDIVHRVALYEVIAWNPQYSGKSRGRVPLKTPNSTKCTIFDAFRTKCIRGGVPCTMKFVSESKDLPNALRAIGVCA